MPAARNQEVTVRRPRAKRMPTSSSGRRGAERLCSQPDKSEKTVVSNGGRYENDIAGSWTRGSLDKSHRVQGAGVRPATCVVHYPVPLKNLPVLQSLRWAMMRWFPRKYSYYILPSGEQGQHDQEELQGKRSVFAKSSGIPEADVFDGKARKVA